MIEAILDTNVHDRDGKHRDRENCTVISLLTDDELFMMTEFLSEKLRRIENLHKEAHV